LNVSLNASASQTIGPFFRIGLAWGYRAEFGSSTGERVAVEGRLYDGSGQPLHDSILELWQADEKGRYDHREDPRRSQVAPDFRGFGRVETDADGIFHFSTSKPGRVAGADGALQAPHLTVLVFTRGLLKPVYTRMYFPDTADASDPVLALVPPARRGTLIARSAASGLHWDVHLQGERETVFFDF
jgi:protocatechuate 3,4-dioxygenase alpha subunit